MFKRGAKNRIAGYNLLELSIVIIIFSITMSMGINFVKEFTKIRHYKVTFERLIKIEEALIYYFKQNKYLPCSERNLVPVRQLSLSRNYIYDGWGDEFSYILHEDLICTNGKSYFVDLEEDAKIYTIDSINSDVSNNYLRFKSKKLFLIETKIKEKISIEGVNIKLNSLICYGKN